MAQSFSRRLTFAVTSAAFAGMLAAGATAGLIVERTLAEHYRQSAYETSALLASRVGDEIRSASERARFYASSPAETRKLFDADPDLFALTVFEGGSIVSRWARPAGDPLHLDESDFRDIDLKYPVDLEQAGRDRAQAVLGTARNQSPFVRLAVRAGQPGRAVVAEMRQHKILALLAEAREAFSFVVDADGRLIASSDASHFTQAEDLSALEVLRAARESDSPHGSVDYAETPGGETQYAGFSRVAGPARLTVVTQIPGSRVTAALATYAGAFAATMAIALMAVALLSSLLAWRLVGKRLVELRRMLEALRMRAPSAVLADERPEGPSSVRPRDPLADLASTDRLLKQVSKDLERREEDFGTSSKFRSPELIAKLNEGAIPLTGSKAEAVVLHAHFHGLDLLVEQADPKRLIGIVNELNQAASGAIEAHGGILDHSHGGSMVAYWGVPLAHEDDAARGLRATLALREAVERVNGSLEKAGLPTLRLGMGMHCSPVVAGQVGAPGRMEYSALGPALELASRIQGFTGQFGTDLLMTESMAGKLPQEFVTENVTAGDDLTPPLFELLEHREAQALAA